MWVLHTPPAQLLHILLFSFTVLENQKFYEKNFSKKLHTQKKWTEWRAERGTRPKLSTFLSQLKGFFAKHQKIEGGKILIYGKKSHSAEKN